MAKVDKHLYEKGIRFECTGCGECCKSHGRFQYVYVSIDERRELAQHLGMSTTEFTREHCQKSDGWFHLRNPIENGDGQCRFLDGKRCTVYAARPQQCRTWPWWPSNMNEKVWKLEVIPDCEGVGRGRLHSPEEIEAVMEQEAERQSKI